MSVAVQVEAALLAFACFVAAVVSGALARFRRDEFTRPQGAVRASVMVFLVASGINAVGVVLDWPLAWRVTPMVVAAWLLLGALLLDLWYESRLHPGRGPLAPLARIWRRFRRR